MRERREALGVLQRSQAHLTCSNSAPLRQGNVGHDGPHGCRTWLQHSLDADGAQSNLFRGDKNEFHPAETGRVIDLIKNSLYAVLRNDAVWPWPSANRRIISRLKAGMSSGF